MNWNKILPFTLLLCGLVGMAPASSQTAWPEGKPITFVNPFPPGGAVDAFGRPLAHVLGEQLKTTIIVDNRGGAGGTIGAAAAARMAPDGYTWFLGAVHHAIAPSIYPQLSYDMEKNFVPVALISDVPHVIVANPKNVPESNLKELLARMKKSPGKIDYASTGIGTSQHLAGELFKTKTGTAINHVPYRGTGPALQDMVAGHVDIMFDTLAGSSKFIGNGQLKPIAVTSAERVPGYENVPTALEEGVKDYTVTSWYALFAIKGTPQPIIDRMTAEVTKALANPDITGRWKTMGATVRPLTGKELGTFVKEETKRWGEVVRGANIKLE